MVQILKLLRKWVKTMSVSHKFMNISAMDIGVLIWICSLLWASHARCGGFAVSTHVSPDPNRAKGTCPRPCSQHGLFGYIRGRRSVRTVSALGTSLTTIELMQYRNRLLNTIRQGDFYILTDDFDSCEFFLDYQKMWTSEYDD